MAGRWSCQVNVRWPALREKTSNAVGGTEPRFTLPTTDGRHEIEK
jgi:hypothetical protein